MSSTASPEVLDAPEEKEPKSCQVLPGGFAGTGPNGSFFEAPAWVDKSKAPGTTSQEAAVAPPGWWIPLATGKFLFFSPNLVWLLIALVDYFVFPYDFQAAKTFDSLDWVYYRFAVNFGITFGFFGFWHCALYLFGWSERPFLPNRRYRLSKVIHNMFYSTMGVVQFTVWEAIFLHCYATNRLPYLSDEQAFSTPWNTTMFILAAFWVPLYREFHFYFAHRFIHIKALYKYVHSLHHRNTDIEPFAGLCMHPIEHLYYYSCVGPSLLVFATPFAFMWNGVHLLISPAASHSGWEDHFQADQYHYLHHRFFECNYGTSGTPFDKMFGTFRDKLKETGPSTYRGGSEEKVDTKTASAHDAKASLTTPPDAGFVIYMGVNCAIWAILWLAVRQEYQLHTVNPHYLALLVSAGPVVLAQVMANLTENTKRSMFYPFHKDGWKVISGHVFISSLVCIGPVYAMVHMLLSQPGQSIYFWLRG